MTSVLAHRGSVNLDCGVAENTLAAFTLAAELGADGVELDVRRTADGYLVLHHDALVPAAGAEAGRGASGLRISANRLDQLLEQLPALPSLADALDLCLSLGLFVNVEVKSEPSGPSLDPDELCALTAAEVCVAAGAGTGTRGSIVVSSFSLPALAAVRSAGPGLALAWLCEPRTPVSSPGLAPAARGSGPSSGETVGPALSWGAIAAGIDGSGGLAGLSRLGLEGIHPYYRQADAAFVAGAYAAGLAVRTWTVDRPDRIAAALANGVDAVITNDVTTVLRVVASL